MINNNVSLDFKNSKITATIEGENIIKLAHIGFKDKKIFNHMLNFSDLNEVLLNGNIENSSIKITKDDTRTLKVRISSKDETGNIILTSYCSMQDYITFIKKLCYLKSGNEMKDYQVLIGDMEYTLNSIDIEVILYLLKNGIVGQGLFADKIYYTNNLIKVGENYKNYTSFEISIAHEKYLCTISSGSIRNIIFNEQPALALNKPEEVSEKYFNDKDELINFINKLIVYK